MAIETTLTVTGTEYVTVAKSAIWFVDTEEAAEAVETASACAVLVKLTDGTKTYEVYDKWTKTKGTGDLNTVPLKKKDSHGVTVSAPKVYIAFSPFTMGKDKGGAFVKELTSDLKALGSFVEVITLPAGTTLDEIAAAGGQVYTNDYLVERVEAAIKKAEKAKPAAVTIQETPADIMYDIAYADFFFNQSDKGEPFITSKSGPSHIAIPFSELGFYLLREYKDRLKQVAAPKELKAALATIEADCAKAGKAILGLRTVTSPSTGSVWIDLGRADGQVVRLTEDNWELHDTPDWDVFFKRTSVIKELPIPTACAVTDTFGRLQGIRRFANIPDAQWPLVVGWMVTHMIPDEDHLTPLVFFLGGSQSGKTTISVLTRYITEGILDKGTDSGAREGDLQLTMSKERIKTLNNISSISPEMSDLLCQVYEGYKITGRKMYTQDEEATLEINCSVIANGVTVGGMKPDLKTRVMVMDIDPKHGGTPWLGAEKEQSKTINDEMKRVHADALGALLTLAVVSLKHHGTFYESVRDDIFRLKGFATVLRTLDLVWQLEGQTVNEYKKLMDIMSEEAIEDPMFECIRRLAITGDNYNAEAKVWELEIDLMTLKNKLNETGWKTMMDSVVSGSKSSGFTSTKAVSDAITRKSTDWKRLGVTYENAGRKRAAGSGNKQTYFKFTFKHDVETSWSQMPDTSISL
jgi:hypothetical protein